MSLLNVAGRELSFAVAISFSGCCLSRSSSMSLSDVAAACDLLDRLPDMHVAPPAIDFPQLRREPKAERYSVLDPIADYPFD